MRMRIALRTRNTTAVLAESGILAQSGFRKAEEKLAFFRMCPNHVSQTELNKAVAEIGTDSLSSRDPELSYQNAEDLAFCGQMDAALRQLAKAIKGNHCSYPAMDKDPLFDPIRQRPEFVAARQSAVQCQEKFLTHRKQVDATLNTGQ